MQQAPFSFPQWIEEVVPDDALFARAYEDISDRNRAWLKTCIARLYDYYGASKVTGSDTMRRWTGGFETLSCKNAVDFAVVLFDDSLMSPARLLGALVPALACGVRHVLAARVGAASPWRKAVLTGLELAGQELVADLDEKDTRRLFNHLRESGHSGSVVVLGPKAATVKSNELQAASRMAFWRPRFSRMAVVWMEDETTFDLDALAFVHPDMQFKVYGFKSPLPSQNFSYGGASFDHCLEGIMDVAYLPAGRMDAARDRAKVLLGPGHEGCWVWPDLHSEHFQFHSTAWTMGA